MEGMPMAGLDAMQRVERGFRGPAWRWDWSRQSNAQRPWHPLLKADVVLRKLLHFHRLLNQDAALAAYKYPEVSAAQRLWSNAAMRERLELLTIAEVPLAEIAKRLAVDVDVVQAAQEIFFDVGAMLHCHTWIVTQVINREADRGRDQHAAQLRLAYFGGPTAALELIDSGERLPSEDSALLVDATLQLHARMLQALQMPAAPEAFLAFYSDIRRDDQWLALQREKLQFRMRRWADRLAVIREQRTASEPKTSVEVSDVSSDEALRQPLSRATNASNAA